ncbi:hypothetical protein RHMOL_Rhmol13G0128500 [Rhododendron molle]|uniref:Uncharacterized protein n=1 Tax=Rhododendron molle TaxID=49168 RepID=A0ACC0L6N3_RHOML|nr:hypothetical protein RHMOL_Rhmol13G0128500 [Rhododendron molle]
MGFIPFFFWLQVWDNLRGEILQCRSGTGQVGPSTISAVQTCFKRPRSVCVIFKCKIIKTPPQAQTDLGRS